MTRIQESRTDEIRIGDTERDAVVVALHDHFAAGRLERAELDERMDAALSAKTRGDLRALVQDLPPPHGLAASPTPRPVPVQEPAPWGGPGPMFAGHHHRHHHPRRPGHHMRHRHRHHGPPFPAFPLMLGVFLVLTFTMGAGTGLLAALGIAALVWLARAARLATTGRM